MDQKLNDELRAKYNPEGSDLRKAQMRMLELLRYIAQVCEKNSLRYWLCGGTMLGAVRHGGFIPWDDDLDIEMPKKDFKKLIKIFKKELPPYYVVHNHHNDPWNILLFTKLRDKDSYFQEDCLAQKYKYQGCFVDIFAMEKSSRWICNWSHKFYFNITRMMYHNMFILGNITYYIFKAFIQPLARLLSLFSTEKALYQPIGKYKNNPRYLCDIYPLQKVSFEGELFYAPHNIDGYLKQIFGDSYMNIPSNIFQHSNTIKVYSHKNEKV